MCAKAIWVEDRYAILKSPPSQAQSMSQFSSNIPLLIIGAGAAGLGASEQATILGIDHLVIEASHRIGGRALTEPLNNAFPVDLGCHWMHCGSKNSLAEKAAQLQEPFEKEEVPYRDFVDGRWKEESYSNERWGFIDRLYREIDVVAGRKELTSIWDCIEENHAFVPWSSYWLSLMHSNDPDQVSVSDIHDFIDTQEDWPVTNGYGSLIARCGSSAPVSLNTAVNKIDLTEQQVKVYTNKGVIRAEKVVVTVSTGVLAAQDIEFLPALPDRILNAIHDLPMGNYNYLFYALQPGEIPPETFSIAYQRDGNATSLRLREFGRPMLSIPVAGRFAWWLEGQSDSTIENWGREVISDIFGENAKKDIINFKRSAWGFDQWIKGAYSSAKPGSMAARADLHLPVENKLWFAGEAVSKHVFNTAHGAWESGQRAVQASAS